MKRVLTALAATLPFAANAADAISGAVERQPTNWQAIIMFLIFVVFTLGITYWASKRVRSRSDYYTAGGNITGFQNGLAIAGDFMSAASFLGISALVYTSGYDGLIYSLGFLVGWPIILFLIAERLRNLGRYTFADVASYRLKQGPIRTLSACGSLVLVALGLFVGSRPFPIARLRGWVGSLLGAAASFAVLAGLILTVYASNDLYNSFRVSNAYYIPSVFNELGFPYCFCHQFTTYPVDKPEGFSRSEAAGWDQGGDTGLGKDVNVIMVMDEAFSDITDSDAFAFTAENDPLPNLHALREDPHAVAGHIVVPGFAGGTANTEFDVLTGMQTNALAAGTTSSFRVVNRNLDSLFRVFGGDGYHTSFFHPGDDWFYNRENVYRWFGAEETVFADQMEALAYKGRWVTDDYMAGLIEQEFADTVAAGETLFHYTTTIQNHMSYTLDKYGESYAYPEVPLNTAVSDEVETLLRVYTEGARDADAMLGRLVDTFSAVEEPVVLVFFGDHLPYLGDNQLAYAELGFTARPEWDALTSYETPYVIWANDAAAQALDWEAAVASLDLPEDGRLSASFLGAAVLELTGRTGESPWFDFLNQLRRELPVVQKQAYQLADGTVTDQLTEEQAAKIAKWRQWSYYKLMYKEID